MPASKGDTRLGYLAAHPDWQQVAVPKSRFNQSIHTLAPTTLYEGVGAVREAVASQPDLVNPYNLAILCQDTAQVPEDSRHGFAELMARLWNKTKALEDGDNNKHMIGM